jgi:leader peptidase (prepilin peptidase) / N-methyltransferase
MIEHIGTFWYIYLFVLGTLIGSFLNVVIYRLHTGRSVNGRSHCMSCGETLRWYELFPIVSYLFLRARCKYCSAYIPLRYLAVELLTGLVFMLIFYAIEFEPASLVFHLILAALLIVITLYDIRHTIIPDELTIGVGVLSVAYVVLLSNGAIGYPSLVSVGTALGAGVGAWAFFYMLWRVSKGKWLGLGDAKLALPLGVIAGSGSVVSMIVLSFWVGAAISLILLLFKRIFEAGTTTLRFPLPRLTIQSEVPFAPFLILGFLLAHLFHADIFVITSYMLSAFGI